MHTHDIIKIDQQRQIVESHVPIILIHPHLGSYDLVGLEIKNSKMADRISIVKIVFQSLGRLLFEFTLFVPHKVKST